MKRTQASVIGFIVIAGVLTALLLSGVYIVRERAAQYRQEPVAQEETAQQSPEEMSKPEKEEPKKESEVPAPQPDKEDKEERQKQETPQTSTSPSNHQLPQTGAADLWMSVLAVGLLTASSTAYAGSRRSLSL